MTLFRGLVLALVAVLFIGAAGAWYYLFGPNLVSSAKLIPADTIIFANIPNAADLVTGYETSQIKKLVDAPESQPIFDEIQHLVGDKNLALFKVLLPDLSGQSFIALTHFDPSKPGETGFVAAMKPKAGTDNFNTFVTQVNAAYPEMAQETKTGSDKLLGVDYQWIEGNHSPGRVCVAHYRGWIVTAWGEASLQDWIERMQGKSASPSLADNADYQKSFNRLGKGAQATVYLDSHQLLQLLGDHLEQTHPGFSARVQKQLASVGPAAIGTSFENGEMVDHFSLLVPKQAQLDNGLSAEPCSFESLKFTGPDTRFYLGAAMNWATIWKNFQDPTAVQPPVLRALLDQLQSWAQGENLDVQKNIIDALGSEYSIQLEWPADSTYPDLGILFKVDKPDAFKPTVAAIIDTARKEFTSTAVIDEMNAGGINFATLKPVNPMPVSPTITEDGPWFGLFLNPTHAVRSMARDESRGLLHSDDFNREIGDQRQGAAGIVYFDSPRFLDQAYRTALPFVSMGAMFNPTLASLLKDRNLPPDLTWLAPMGPWGVAIKSDDDGLTGYSRSGIGNQSILIVGGLGGAFEVLQMAGILPHAAPQTYTTVPVSGNPNAVTPPAPAPGADVPPVPPVPAAPTTPPAPDQPATPPTPPDANSATPPPSPAGSTH